MSEGRRTLPRRRTVGKRGIVLWGFSGLSALVLALGVSGTLSSWTSAVITNDTNTTATAGAVILQESSGAGPTICRSSDGTQTTVNSFSCSTINKYGGTTTPLAPGGASAVTDVTFKNIGGANGTSFSLAPGTCTYSPTTGTPTPTNLCTSGDLKVAISCVAGATYTGTPWADLTYAAAAPPTVTKIHTAAAGDLNVNAQWTCRVTVSLSATAPIAAQGITVSQPLTWTLNG